MRFSSILPGKWLGQKGSRPQSIGFPYLVVITELGQHDDEKTFFYGGLQPKPFQHGKAIHAGHLQI